jgi:hypothetical protein
MPHRVGRAGLQEVDAWYRPYGLAHITQNIGIPYNILKKKSPYNERRNEN